MRSTEQHGNTVWKRGGVGGIADGGGGALSYDNGTIVFGDGTALNAEDGSVQWCVANDQVTLGNHTIDDDTVYYIRTEYIAGDDRTVEWTYESDSNGWDGRLVVTDDHVLFLESNDGMSVVKALDSETGTPVWIAEVSGSYFSSPTVADKTVYVGGRYTSESNRLNGRAVIYTIDQKTGDRKWAYLLDSSDLETSPENPPAAGMPVVTDEKLFSATYPLGSTLTYRYVYYSNFFVLGCVMNGQTPTIGCLYATTDRDDILTSLILIKTVEQSQ